LVTTEDPNIGALLEVGGRQKGFQRVLHRILAEQGLGLAAETTARVALSTAAAMP
jgi:hypothetical protein